MRGERCAYCLGGGLCVARGVRLVGGVWWCADHVARGRRELRGQMRVAALTVGDAAVSASQKEGSP
ncbi:hypothetical protein DRW03_06315 [Corallococcus sp. H22C18031201]|nr:hypothetical protein DRW03_06315 [Corallococcus sp. H22C18031201]